VTNSIAVTRETPLTVLARAEGEAIVNSLLKQVQESGKAPDLSALFVSIAASAYLSGIMNGMALACMNADAGDKLICGHLTPEQYEVTGANMRSFLHQVAEWTP